MCNGRVANRFETAIKEQLARGNRKETEVAETDWKPQRVEAGVHRGESHPMLKLP